MKLFLMEDKMISLEFSGEKGTVTQRAGARHCNTVRRVCTMVTHSEAARATVTQEVACFEG